MKRCTAWIVACGLVAAVATAGRAQEQEQSAEQLRGTLGKIDRSGVVTIGYREASFPLSYVDPKGQPIGYSIDLCKAILGEIAHEIDNPRIKIEYAPVTPEARIPALLAGKIDLECGSSTNNTERQKQVAFSPLIFVSGTKLMVKRGSGIRSYKDLKGKVVVVTQCLVRRRSIVNVKTSLTPFCRSDDNPRDTPLGCFPRCNLSPPPPASFTSAPARRRRASSMTSPGCRRWTRRSMRWPRPT